MNIFQMVSTATEVQLDLDVDLDQEAVMFFEKSTKNNFLAKLSQPFETLNVAYFTLLFLHNIL